MKRENIVVTSSPAVRRHVFPLAFGLALAFIGCWLVLLVGFIGKRLKHTSKKFTHVVEMIVTSACIPFISVYWQLYGAWRYRVFFF